MNHFYALSVLICCAALNITCAQKQLSTAIAQAKKSAENILMKAINIGDLQAVEKLLQDDALRTKLLNQPEIVQGFVRETPLSRAALNGQQEIVKKLIQAGADINFSDWQGNSIFMRTVQKDNSIMVRLLASLGANNNKPNNEGTTPLMIAIKNNKPTLFKILLGLPSIEIKASDNTGTTALMIAASVGNKDIVKELVSNLSQADLNKKNNEGQTALMHAVKAGHWNIALLLTELGATPDTQDKYGDTPLILALKANQKAIAKQLIKKSTNISIRNNQGLDAFKIAAQQGDFDIILLLTQRGANINELLPDGSTIVHKALAFDKVDRIPALLDLGILIDAQDIQGMTPLMLAVQKAHIPTIKILLAKGAQTTLKNKSGQTALDLAKSYPDIIAILQPPVPAPAVAQQQSTIPIITPQPLIETAKRQAEPTVIIPKTPGTDAAAASTPPPVFEAPKTATTTEEEKKAAQEEKEEKEKETQEDKEDKEDKV